MEGADLYIREDVYMEPLFNQWYAWAHLVPPATAARHMIHTHKRLMKSFVNNHKLHIMAVNQPGMEGSEFLACSEEQLTDIKALIEQIELEHTDFDELSRSLKELNELLSNHSSGESIESLYSQIPEPLQGYVELYMDMEHNPSYRLLESLLYESKYYKPALQSISFGSLARVEERPFCFSTPRLADENHVQLKIDFNSPDLDTLLMARDQPVPEDVIDDIFTRNECVGGLPYRELFTTTPPEHSYTPPEEGLRVEYIGHAGLLIESQKTRILVDPVVASRNVDNSDDITSFGQLPPAIDYVCLTHCHQDHICLETLLQLRHKVKTIVVPKNNGGTICDPSMRLILKRCRFNVVEVDDLDEITLDDGKIISIPFLGEHGDLNIRSKTAWVFDLGGRKIFVGADSSNLDPSMYRHIKRYVGDIDIVAIGMECVGAPFTWIYGALFTKMVSKRMKDSRRLNGSDAEQALQITKILEPSRVYLYALGLEPWYKYFMGIAYDENSRQMIETEKMIKACGEMNIPAERLYGKKTLELS